MTQISAIMENKASENKALINEHGLSFFIEKDNKRILFDCGSGEHTLYNAHKLGIELSNLDCVVLSHSHYDHSAGYRDLTEAGLGSKELYIGKGFFEKKYAFDGIKYTDLSCGFDLDFITKHGINVHEVSGKVEIIKDIYAFGGFARLSEFEHIPTRFVKRTEEGFVNDYFSDEICLVIDKKDYVVMVCGCSHPGITNMVREVRKSFGKPVFSVYGGIHLNEADDKRMDDTMETLHSMGMVTGGFCHCSGDKAEKVCSSSGLSGCHLSVGDSVFI